MKLPETIKIGGHIYKVIFPHDFTELDGLCGDINYSRNEIRLASQVHNTKIADSSLIVTFIHEILHGIDYITAQEIFTGEKGEKKIEALSEGIFQVLVDNGYLQLEHDFDPVKGV